MREQYGRSIACCQILSVRYKTVQPAATLAYEENRQTSTDSPGHIPSKSALVSPEEASPKDRLCVGRLNAILYALMVRKGAFAGTLTPRGHELASMIAYIDP